MIGREAITGLILCGGAGRRMGGVDKPLLRWQGRALVDHVITRMAPHCGPLLISANRSRAGYEAFGYPVIADRLPDAGPLAGLHAVLPHLATDYLFVCAGDMPMIDPAIIPRLAAGFEQDAGAGIAAAVAHDGEQIQPLVLMIRRHALGSLDAFLHAGGRAVHEWLGTIGAVPVDAADLAVSFRNMNTPGDLDAD